MLIISMQVGKELASFLITKSHSVVVKMAVLVHVIDVGPNRLRRNVKPSIVIYHFLKPGRILVDPAALVKPGSKVLLHSQQITSVSVKLCLYACGG
jgi:hypothetical protein